MDQLLEDRLTMLGNSIDQLTVAMQDLVEICEIFETKLATLEKNSSSSIEERLAKLERKFP